MKSTGGGPIWLYWEGPRAAYIDLCLKTVFLRHPGARLLDRPAFENLWKEDRDLPLDALALNHKSDFIRAYLLQYYGGMYIDADCIVMRDLTPLLELASEHGFVGYREPHGYMSCNFMASAPRGAVISDHYFRVCRRLRERRPLQWLDLASVPMNEAVATHGRDAHVLPVQAVMPLAWNESQLLAMRRDDSEHERHVAADAWCYMLSNNTIKSDERTRVLAYMVADHLLSDRYFLSYLLRKALGARSPAAHGPDGVAASPCEVPAHLGGHEFKTQFDEGAFDYLQTRFGVSRFLDVGCGQPGMVYYALSRGVDAKGVDGDPTYARDSPVIFEHDYSRGPIEVGDFDLGWAVEFVEHVEEEFIPNFMATLARCTRVFITAAVPGQPGHHHVNCQPGDYWIARFAAHGFVLDKDSTEGVRAHSTMRSGFTRQTGMVFERERTDA